jgi:hypothetical protein
MNIVFEDGCNNAVLTIAELRLIHQAFNEVCHGLCLRDLSRIGKVDNVENEMQHLVTIYDNAMLSKDEEVRIKLDIERAKMYRNVIAIVCEEIEDWEFQTRIGETRFLANEMQKVFENVLSNADRR